MTLVAACVFDDGAIVLADSRVTWVHKGTSTPDDALQKILYLRRNAFLAYAGNVAAVALLTQELRKRLLTDLPTGSLKSSLSISRV